MNTYSFFYKENKDRLYAYLLRMTGDHQLALDLVQESFTRYLGRYGNREKNKSLLYTIARNAALDVFRRQKITEIDSDSCQDSGDDPEQQVLNQEIFNHTMAAIAKLAPIDRELISLVTASDLTYQEIGRVLKISEANVKVRIHRARTKLRVILASGGE